jgi:ABC-type Na+ transport system ATPase subunit NatA
VPIRLKKLSPKAKMALQMIALGAANNKEAAKAVGLHPAYIPQLKASEPGQKLMSELGEQIDEKALETSVLMDRLGREALHRLAGLMRFSQNENIILRTSQDLADRSPLTSKIQKHQVESFSLGATDAKAIAEALVQSAAERQKYIEAKNGNFIRVENPNGLGRDAA